MLAPSIIPAKLDFLSIFVFRPTERPKTKTVGLQSGSSRKILGIGGVYWRDILFLPENNDAYKILEQLTR